MAAARYGDARRHVPGSVWNRSQTCTPLSQWHSLRVRPVGQAPVWVGHIGGGVGSAVTDTPPAVHHWNRVVPWDLPPCLGLTPGVVTLALGATGTVVMRVMRMIVMSMI